MHGAPAFAFPLTLGDRAVTVRSNDAAFIRDVVPSLFRRGLVAPQTDLTYDVLFEGGEGHLLENGRPVGHGTAAIELLLALHTCLYQQALRSVSQYMVHGAAVGQAGRSLLLVAGTGSGKSTLTALLAAAGLGVLSDDVTPLDAVARTYPYPRRMVLREESLALNPTLRDALRVSADFIDAADDAHCYVVWPEHGQETPPTAHLATIVFPTWSSAPAPCTARRLRAAEALPRLTAESLNLAALGPAGLRQAALLARTIPAYALHVRDPLAARDWLLSQLQ